MYNTFICVSRTLGNKKKEKRVDTAIGNGSNDLVMLSSEELAIGRRVALSPSR